MKIDNNNNLGTLRSMMNLGVCFTFLVILRVGKTCCAGDEPAQGHYLHRATQTKNKYRTTSIH
jgi:hypothetical protein